MNKNLWYYENAVTGEITTDKWLVDFWAEVNHVSVNCWRWSEFSQEWEILMVREP